MWQLRNTQAHEDNTEPSTTDVLLNQKIDKLYQLQDEISHYDKNIFHKPIEERYKLNRKQKIDWIDQTTKTLYKCMADHHKNMTSGQKDIRQYFQKQKDNRKG